MTCDRLFRPWKDNWNYDLANVTDIWKNQFAYTVHILNRQRQYGPICNGSNNTCVQRHTHEMCGIVLRTVLLTTMLINWRKECHWVSVRHLATTRVWPRHLIDQWKLVDIRIHYGTIFHGEYAFCLLWAVFAVTQPLIFQWFFNSVLI